MSKILLHLPKLLTVGSYPDSVFFKSLILLCTVNVALVVKEYSMQSIILTLSSKSSGNFAISDWTKSTFSIHPINAQHKQTQT